jgi:hypothetical protein
MKMTIKKMFSKLRTRVKSLMTKLLVKKRLLVLIKLQVLMKKIDLTMNNQRRKLQVNLKTIHLNRRSKKT